MKTIRENKGVIIGAVILVIVMLLVIYGLIKWHEATTFYTTMIRWWDMWYSFKIFGI